jgi:hypothetical protein
MKSEFNECERAAVKVCPSTSASPTNDFRELQAAQRRAALIARLAQAQRKPAHLRLADRLEALQRFLDAPTRAIRRFARKLRQAPRIALALVAQRTPASPYLAPEIVRDCEGLSYNAAFNSS